jgi:hypothetical protein
MRVTNVVLPLVLIMTLGVLVMVTTTIQQARADAGSDAGAQAAREDFRNGYGYHGGCADHGYDNTRYTHFCLSFKTGYAATWLLLEASR